SNQECVERMKHEYQTRRDLVLRSLKGIPGIRPLVPDGGLFVMLDLRELIAGQPPRKLASDLVRRFLLEKHGVVLIHGSAYGAAGEGFLRVSFAAGGRALETGLVRLREGLCDLA